MCYPFIITSNIVSLIFVQLLNILLLLSLIATNSDISLWIYTYLMTDSVFTILIVTSDSTGKQSFYWHKCLTFIVAVNQ